MPPSVIHRTVLTCRHILDGAPVLEVSRDRREGVWRYLCGCRTHRGAEMRLVSRRAVVERDEGLAVLDGMPTGGRAERTHRKADWRATPLRSRA